MDNLLDAITDIVIAKDNGDEILFKIKSNGAYVGRVNIYYKLDGCPLSQNMGHITAGVTKTCRLPKKITNINIKAEAAVFIGIWATICDISVEPADGEIELEIFGTTLNRKWSLNKGKLVK